MQGNYDLPPSPDMLLLGTITAIAAGTKTRITPVLETPLTAAWVSMLREHVLITRESDAWIIDPTLSDPSVLFILPFDDIPYRDLIVFAALGMGKTVVFKSITPQRIERWSAQAKQCGFTIEKTDVEGSTGLHATDIPEIFPESIPVDENDLCPFLGLLMGSRKRGSFQAGFQVSNPVRHLCTAFGFEFTVKNLTERESDPIARRMRFMNRKKTVSEHAQSFVITADFTKRPDGRQIELTLPGDEILQALLITAKCLVAKGSLALGNVPIEPWASQILNFIRKMGCKVSVQETAQTSFGSSGIVTIQKFDLVGRKVECVPLYQYIPHLPSMIVLASFAESQSVFRELQDLRLDVPDGIDTLERCIRALGARHGEMPDGIVMEGAKEFDGFDLPGKLPESICGAFAVAGLRCMGTTTVNDEAVLARWPEFMAIVERLCDVRSKAGEGT